MLAWHRMRAAWRNLTRKQRFEDDLDAEIQSYRALLEDEKTRSGADPRQAAREARLEMAGVDRIKEQVRDIRAGAALLTLGAELRQSLRGLRRNPGLAILGVLMLALGTGAGTAVFSIFQAALLQPLPFRDGARVVQLWQTSAPRGIEQHSFSEANFWDLRTQNHAFQELAAYHYDEANLTGQGPAERVMAVSVTAGFFRALGVTPVLGRDFSYDEDRDGWNNHVALLGNRFWHSRFGGERQILGKTVRLNDRVFTVIGVLPPGEPWLTDDFYIPFGYRPNPDRGSWEYDVVGRLAPGILAPAAQTDLERVAAILARSYPKDDAGIGFRLAASSTWIAAGTTRRALWVLLGAVAFLLLIGCLNIANLLLARGTARQREIAVRAALGAGRARLVRFVMLESLLLSGAGTLLGITLAYAAVRAIQALEIHGIPRVADAGLNPWVLGFAATLALLTGIVSGLAPAWQTPSQDLATRLREADRQTGSRAQGRLRAALVTTEVALSFVLLVGAGLLIRSFVQLTSVNRGFQTEGRLWFSVSMPFSYWEDGVGKQFLDRFLSRLSGEPAVIAAGAVSNRPVEGGNPGMSIDSRFRPSAAGPPPWAGWRIVSPAYFRAIGLPLLHGRAFDEGDKPVWVERGQPEPERRVILSASLARLLFPGRDGVGERVALWSGQNNLPAQVVGVVADSRERGLASSLALTVYLPYGRNALPQEFVVHTRIRPLALAPAVRSLVASLDPSLPVADVRSFDEVISRSVAPERWRTVLLATFSGLALLLASIGIYGVLAYSIARRTAEIGLRIALGANRARILRTTLAQGLWPALLGIALGAIGAWWLARYTATLLFGVQPFDAPTYLAVAVLLFATALIACYLPGRRAMRIDPATALRIE
jgi:putative ABC transport system permease protein